MCSLSYKSFPSPYKIVLSSVGIMETALQPPQFDIQADDLDDHSDMFDLSQRIRESKQAEKASF